MGVVEWVRLGGEVRATHEAQPKVVHKWLAFAKHFLELSAPTFSSTSSSILRYGVSPCGYDKCLSATWSSCLSELAHRCLCHGKTNLILLTVLSTFKGLRSYLTKSTAVILGFRVPVKRLRDERKYFGECLHAAAYSNKPWK